MSHESREPPSAVASSAQTTHSNLPLVALAAWQWLQDNTFAPQWLPARWRHPAAGCILAVLLQAVAAVATRLLMGSFSAYSFPGLAELLIVSLVTLSWGAGPGLFAVLVGLAFEETVVLPMERVGPGDLIEIALFLLVGISICLVASFALQSRQRSEAQASELASMHLVQERMDDFLAIASHELRTPVTATVGFIQVAARRCDPLAAAVRREKPDLAHLVDAVWVCVREAGQSGERLTRLVNVLLDTALVRTGKLELHRAPCDLAALVRSQVAALRMAAPSRTIRLLTLVDEPVWIDADADRVGQVISNYLTNALKYSAGDQAIDVRLAVVGGWARVAVEDRGSGLPPGELEHIWQRFYRATGVSARGTASGGLGVGLHVCKAIVEAHGGEVGVESAVGRGSTFWFALPVAAPAA